MRTVWKQFYFTSSWLLWFNKCNCL